MATVGVKGLTSQDDGDA